MPTDKDINPLNQQTINGILNTERQRVKDILLNHSSQIQKELREAGVLTKPYWQTRADETEQIYKLIFSIK